jgi:hypothetical protein
MRWTEPPLLMKLALRYSSAALAEADLHAIWFLAMRAENHLVAILEKGPRLAGAQGDPTLAIGAQLHQTAIALRCRTRDRTGTEQIAGRQIAPATSVVSDQLGDCPVEIGRVARRHLVWR